MAQGALTAAGSGEEVIPASDYQALQSQSVSCTGFWREGARGRDPQRGAGTRHRLKKTTAAVAVAAQAPLGDEDWGRRDRGRSVQSDRVSGRAPEAAGHGHRTAILFTAIKVVITDLPTLGYRRMYAILKRRALVESRQPPNPQAGLSDYEGPRGCCSIAIPVIRGGDTMAAVPWETGIGVGALRASRSAAIDNGEKALVRLSII